MTLALSTIPADWLFAGFTAGAILGYLAGRWHHDRHRHDLGSLRRAEHQRRALDRARIYDAYGIALDVRPLLDRSIDAERAARAHANEQVSAGLAAIGAGEVFDWTTDPDLGAE